MALETGALYERRPLSISDSSSPTILYLSSFPLSIFIIVTVEPNTTLFETLRFVMSIISEFESLDSMSLILPSI